MPARDLRPALALTVSLAIALYLAVRWPWTLWITGTFAAYTMLRGLAYVLGAKAAMADPDARPSGAEKDPRGTGS